MLKVTVIRSEWLHGEGTYDSFLKREIDGKMCCLGFACVTAGLTEDEIIRKGSPQGVANVAQLPTSLSVLVEITDRHGVFNNTEVCRHLMDVNDDSNMSDADREADIKAIGASVGIEFEFVD